MRSTHIFVLRLWVDTDEPCQLRGALHSIADDADYPFADAQAFLDLVRRLTRRARVEELGELGEPCGSESGTDEHDD